MRDSECNVITNSQWVKCDDGKLNGKPFSVFATARVKCDVCEIARYVG